MKRTTIMGSKITMAILLSLFLILYLLTAVPNHYLLKTAALDLGMFNHAIYEFSHFKWNYFTTGIVNAHQNYFSDHFSPITLLIAPLWYLSGSYTLVILQPVFFVLGALAVFKIAKKFELSIYGQWALAFAYLLNWSIFAALSFDFHTNSLAAVFALWTFYFFQKKEFGKVAIGCLLILMCKETTPLWLAGGILGFGLDYKNLFSKKNLLPSLIFVGVLAYFVLVFMVIMPALRPPEAFDQFFRFSYLGSSWGEIFRHLVSNPLELVKILFYEVDGQTISNVKVEWWGLFLLSGGFGILFNRKLIFVLAPLLILKFLPNDITMWSGMAHYSIEFLPIVVIGLIPVVKYIERWNPKISLAVVILPILTIIFYNNHAGILGGDNVRSKAFVWHKDHFSPQGINVQEIYSAINKIPSSASVSASSVLIPHLANRSKIYMCPNNLDSDFIALFKKNRGSYPLSFEERLELIESLRTSPQREVVFENDNFVLFKKSQIHE